MAKKLRDIIEDWEHNPSIGWWRDKKDYVTVYHGTHEKNHESVMANGITNKDHKTGMISTTLDPHTAHGYAAMSGVGGEHRFRDAGAKAIRTPEDKRVVYKIHLPVDWLHKHIDPDLRGNIGLAKDRLSNETAYRTHANSGRPDHEYYAMSEIRVNKEIPKEFIKGVLRKK